MGSREVGRFGSWEARKELARMKKMNIKPSRFYIIGLG